MISSGNGIYLAPYETGLTLRTMWKLESSIMVRPVAGKTPFSMRSSFKGDAFQEKSPGFTVFENPMLIADDM